MQSNRTLGIVFLLVLLLGAVAAWQFGGFGDQAITPDAGSPDGASPAPTATAVEADHGEAGSTQTTTESSSVREAVASHGGTDPGLPAIVGQIVGPDDQPIADAEVLGVPGVVFSPTMGSLDDIDLADTDAFDPEKTTERMRAQARDRVAVRSDAEGRFRVRVEGTQRAVSVRVLARGYLILQKSVRRPIDRDADLGTLKLEPGAIVAGRVVDPQGNPIAGADVARILEMERDNPFGIDIVLPGQDAMRNLTTGESAETDSAGRFELAHVDAGEFSLRARHADHPSALRDGLAVAAGQTLPDVLVTMQRGARISGRVRDLPADQTGLSVMASARPKPKGNDPAGGIFGMFGDTDLMSDFGMAFSERRATIGADGAFELRGLKADQTYRLWVGREVLGFGGNGVCSQRIEAAADSNGIELRYEVGITVTFSVVDDESGEPVESLWVDDRLRGGGGFADMISFDVNRGRNKRYPGGKVTLANLRPKKEQKLELSIDAIGHAGYQRKDIALPASGSLDLGVVRLRPNPVVQVTVLAADDDQPVANAKVELQAASSNDRANRFVRFAGGGTAGPHSARTDESGQCTLNAIGDGDGKVEVTCKDFAPASAAIAAGRGELTLRLVRGGNAEVTVLDPAHKPLAEIRVEHRTPAGEIDRQRTDAAGITSFSHLTPGQHAFRIAQSGDGLGFAVRMAGRDLESDGAESGWQEVDIVDRATAALTLEKSPTARLHGIVRENGIPLAGARVTFLEGGGEGGPEMQVAGLMGDMFGQGSKGRSKTGDDGAFELTELPSGSHRLRITHKDRAMPSEIGVTLIDGDNAQDIELDMTTLRGIVRDPQGNPVAGARVTARRAPAVNGADNAGMARMVQGLLPGMRSGADAQETDDNGAFELRGVAADVRLLVEASAKGMAPATTEAKVARGQTVSNIEVKLGQAGKIAVTIADTQSNPFAAATAKYVGDDEDADSVAPVMQILRRGKGTLDGLRPGKWEVEYRGMSRGDQPPQKRVVEVVAGETTTVDFQ
ncbi:MAG: carboxypeptidase regulatory-like domain-containing protein [Planctomycetes bacterium]|nr:carboxypeptidase regulatory-like domain-containing protein [Planctomycetota bacterium]